MPKKSSGESDLVGLANHTLLIARDGAERPIDKMAISTRQALPERGEAAKAQSPI